MKKFMSLLFFLGSLSNCSQNLLTGIHSRDVAGFSGHYDGPSPHHVDRNDKDRRPPSISYCEKYANATAKHVLACTFGVEEAQHMALKFSGRRGREDGYLRGYSWGLNKMSNFVANDSNEILNGERLIDNYNSALANAATEGQNAGNREGESLGSQEAKARFYSALDTNSFPSTKYNVPRPAYQGIQNASHKYIGGIPSVEEILNKLPNNRLSIYSDEEREFRDSNETYGRGPREAFRKDGIYEQSNNQFLDGLVALKKWNEIPSRNRDKYNQLGSGNEAVSNEGRSERKRDENGNLETRPVLTPTPNGEVLVNYKEIFNEAFVKAYSLYAPHAYNRSYHESIDNGQRDGEMQGIEIGRQVASQKGLARAFDREYQSLSFNSYINSYTNSYIKGFGETYNYYKLNSVVTLDFLDIIGEDDDGILQPGELFKVKFKVANIGGVSAPLNYTVSGDVENPIKESNTINPLSSKIITSNAIAGIDSRINNGQDASVLLNVNGLQERIRKDIKRTIAIDEVKSTLSILDGRGLFNVIVKNLTTIKANGKISLELKINGKQVKEAFGSSIESGEKKSYSLDFNGLDPLIWINQSYLMEINLKYNDSLYSTQSFELKGQEKHSLLAEYFDRLINYKGNFSAGKDNDNRINAVRLLLVNINNDEVKSNRNGSGNIYKDNSEETIVGKINTIKSSRSIQSERAQNEYLTLAQAFAKNSKQFKSFLGIHPKRSAYMDIVSKIAGRSLK